MIESLLIKLRNRWQTLLIIVLMLLAVSPAPQHQRWIDAVNQASVALRAGRVGAALDNIEFALRAEPSLASLHLLASDLAFYGRDVQRAQNHLRDAKRLLPENEIGLCRLARDELTTDFNLAPTQEWTRLVRQCSGASQRASDMLLIAFQDHPGPDQLPYLEVLHRASPGDQRLEKAFAELLSIYESDRAIDHLRALSNQNADESALERELLRAIRSSEQEGSPAYTLAQVGQVFARFQEWQLARLAFEQAISMDPGYAEALAYLGLSKLQSGEEGFEELYTALEIKDDNPRTYIFLAMQHQILGEVEAAREALDNAARLDPENPAIAAQLGSVYAEIGDFSAATQAYLVATDLAPDDARFWLLLADYSLQHDLDLRGIGLPAARNAISVDPDDPHGYEMLSKILLELQEFTLATRSIRTTLEMEPRSAQAHYAYGLLLLAKGQKENAGAAFLAASMLDGSGKYDEIAARFLR